jgi:putative MATE family efflux protein
VTRSPSAIAALTRLAVPVIGLNLLTVLTLAVDTAMVGRLPEAERALAALGFAGQVAFLLLVAMIGLTVGTVAMVARAHGAGDSERVNHVLAQSSQLTIALGITVAVAGNLVARPLIGLLGASPEVTDTALDYLRPLMAGTVFPYLVLLYAAVLRGVGNTRLPFFVALGQNAINIFLNYGLILGNMGLPGLGVTGAAVASVTSQAIGAGTLVWILSSGRFDPLRLRLRPSPVDRDLARELGKVGAPAALDLVIINAAFLSIVGMLGRLSEAAVAAHGVGLRVQSIAFVPALGVAQATAALVGQALGAGDVGGARRTLHASMLLSTTISSAMAALIIAFAYSIVGVFDIPSGTELESHAVTWIYLLGFGMPVTGIFMGYAGLLMGAGKTGTNLRINAVVTFTFQIPASVIFGFAFGLGALGIWLAFPLSFAAKLALAYAAYRSGTWAVTGLTPSGGAPPPAPHERPAP